MLSAIRYARGSLELLDQRKLPLEAPYLTVRSVADGWHAIRDMAVRGAPALAVAGALSVAVELSTLQAVPSEASEAARFVQQRLDYLVTSRPTAVNLSEAATRLSRAAREASEAPSATGSSVVEAVILAAEAYFAEDVRTNTALAAHGADALVECAVWGRGSGFSEADDSPLCGSLGGDAAPPHDARDAMPRSPSARPGAPPSLTPPQRFPPPARRDLFSSSVALRLLTHCNTGALATAGVGTALGVARALAARGQLAHVYCTETRPYNQGARLTAFELEKEGMPATLVADSATAGLLSRGLVDAVVVGADRVACNGDTANKVGTLGIALQAAACGVALFVAAPLSTLDAETGSGEAVEVEHRPETELTHCPRTGARVAGDVDAWNPGFDITPGELIVGIITEKGVLWRGIEQQRAGVPYDLRRLDVGLELGLRASGAPLELGLRASGAPLELGSRATGAPLELGSRATGAPLELPLSPTLPLPTLLTPELAVRYVASRPHLAHLLGPASEAKTAWSAREVGDGNVNYVTVVRGPRGAVVLKQALPWVRSVRWALSPARLAVEARALRVQRWAARGWAPRVLGLDRRQSVLAMEFVPPPAGVLRGLVLDLAVAGEVQAAKSCWRRASGEVALFLARAHAKTSRFVVSGEVAWRRLLRAFANPGMVELSDKVIFREPLELACPHNRHSRALSDLVACMRSDEHLKAAVRTLRGIFLDRPQALLHGDLHTGSVMFDPVDELAGGSSAPPSPMHGAPPPERPGKTWIIDQEFAFVGPVAFDLGKWVGNLLLAAWGVWARGRGGAPWQGPDASPASDANSLEACIRRTACAFWEQYVEEFLSVALGSNSQHTGLESLALKAECLAFLDAVQRQALGFAGIVMVRRLVGVAHVADMDSIPDERERDCAELAALAQGIDLLQAFWRGERGEGSVTIEQAVMGHE